MADNKSVKVVTCRGEASWVFATGTGKKQMNKSEKENIFEAAILLEKNNPEVKRLHALASEAFELFTNKKLTASNYIPLTRVNEEGRTKGKDGKALTDIELTHVRVKFKNYVYTPTGELRKITIIDAQGNEVKDFDKSIGNGSIIRMSGVYKGYSHITGGEGVSAWLYGIQVINLIEFNSCENDFPAADDGTYCTKIDDDIPF